MINQEEVIAAEEDQEEVIAAEEDQEEVEEAAEEEEEEEEEVNEEELLAFEQRIADNMEGQAAYRAIRIKPPKYQGKTGESF